MDEILNFRSVSVSGAFNLSRSRVLWHNGTLKVFDDKGVVLETTAAKPEKKPGFLRVWDVKTAKGDIVMRGKCMTCGGRKWWRVMYMPDIELWSLTS